MANTATLYAAVLMTLLSGPVASLRAASPGATEFRKGVEPILKEYCYDCHGDGMDKGGVAFDAFNPDTDLGTSQDLWWRALKNLRADMMPPPKKPQPSARQVARLEHWIKTRAFGLDERNPDPGRVTIRRLNRVEYRNTIRDLMGIEYDTDAEFPPDDTGHGFDNMGSVLTLPPMLLEKYLESAQAIVKRAGPHAVQARLEWVVPVGKFDTNTAAGRRAYAGEWLGTFAGRAFRRPVDETTRRRLTDLAESVYTQPGKTFEQGVAQAMVAVLASPRFLFREEAVEAGRAKHGAAPVDEYSLASRLSYFFWSSMPDEELFRLAGARRLRKNLRAQVKRMLADPKAAALVDNFAGQWLRTRDIESFAIDSDAVMAREAPVDPTVEQAQKQIDELRHKPKEGLTPAEKDDLKQARATVQRAKRESARVELTPELRRAMRQETEDTFGYIVRQDRDLLELVDSDYTFLNERLATYYGITNVTGDQVHRVKLPAGSPRGGVLTQGTVLIVTSNPTRTSPVKRGVFILDNILGTPPPPPPPDLPPLEDAAKGIKDHPPTLRETLALHRESPLCASCHNRMDPLGLAFENFNALGRWREQELGAPVDAAGVLITGEKFNGVAELKQLLVKKYAASFYRTVTEKLLTYALGRGLEYYDVTTVDQIVDRVERSGGKPSALLLGIVESAPFQKTRVASQAAIDRVPETRPREANEGEAVAPGQNAGQNAGLQSGHNGLTVLANVAPEP